MINRAIASPHQRLFVRLRGAAVLGALILAIFLVVTVLKDPLLTQPKFAVAGVIPYKETRPDNAVLEWRSSIGDHEPYSWLPNGDLLLWQGTGRQDLNVVMRFRETNRNKVLGPLSRLIRSTMRTEQFEDLAVSPDGQSVLWVTRHSLYTARLDGTNYKTWKTPFGLWFGRYHVCWLNDSLRFVQFASIAWKYDASTRQWQNTGEFAYVRSIAKPAQCSRVPLPVEIERSVSRNSPSPVELEGITADNILISNRYPGDSTNTTFDFLTFSNLSGPLPLTLRIARTVKVPVHPDRNPRFVVAPDGRSCAAVRTNRRLSASDQVRRLWADESPQYAVSQSVVLCRQMGEQHVVGTYECGTEDDFLRGRSITNLAWTLDSQKLSFIADNRLWVVPVR